MRAPPTLSIVTTLYRSSATLEEFVSRHGLTLPVLLDPGGRVASRAYRTTGYPETFVIDRAGDLVSHTIGPAEWDSPDALAHFRGLLEGTPRLQ